MIALLVGSIIHIWMREWRDLEALEKENWEINHFRKEVHDVYVRMMALSLLGETILEWDDEDVEDYHQQRMEVDSMLCRFCSRILSSTGTSEAGNEAAGNWKSVAGNMIDQIGFHPCQYTEAFHVGSQYPVILNGE